MNNNKDAEIKSMTVDVAYTTDAKPDLTVQPVDRTRRHRFVVMVVLFGLITSATFTLMAALGIMSPIFMSLVDAYVTSQLALAGAVAMSYIAGSVVDYTLGPRPAAKG